MIQDGKPWVFVLSAVLPLRVDFAAAALRRLARASGDADQTRRLLALAVIYDGGSRTEAARVGGVGLQIVRDWVVRDQRGCNNLAIMAAADQKTMKSISTRTGLIAKTQSPARKELSGFRGLCFHSVATLKGGTDALD